MRIIGTAGHVDHGKSSLVAALTGIHPDRLKEEIEREMTIDLGFAWFNLPDGEALGVIDVPGHRDFVGNMLSGIGGIDGVLLLIAADEGMMPQTREHLAILDLLEITTGVVVLSKIDLAPDTEWLELMEMDIHDALQGTSLSQAPIVRISARTGDGLDVLLQTLQDVLHAQRIRADLGRPRLPIDRIFSMPGFGTIVTGTLGDGSFQVGDAVEIIPGGITGKVRGLQNHKNKVDQAHAGSRTAINISGVNKELLHRGQVVTKPGTYQATNLVDARCRLLKDASKPLKHNTQVFFYSGSAEIPATIRLLGMDALQPGGEAFIQVKLSSPALLTRGDHYIIRMPSPAETIGGGLILDPHPQKVHRRYNQRTLQRLQQLCGGTPAEIIEQQLLHHTLLKAADLLRETNLSASEGMPLLTELVEDGILVNLSKPQAELQPTAILMLSTTWQAQAELITAELRTFHQANPLLPGMPLEGLRNKLALPANSFEFVFQRLAQDEQVVQFGSLVRIANHSILLTASQQEQAQALLQKFEQQPFSPPDVKECYEIIGAELVNALISQGKLIAISPDILLTPAALTQMTGAVIAHIKANGNLTLANLRDQFHTSRKYALPVLEYLDKTGVTIRRGESRVLRESHQ